ncbi:MAG: hypothetical protein COV67_13265 [Nitrospinae bacterium CG11_big_fil_rev_8_21_14_0_20_56_8]|nr:MAG: hypothetical protein COV67_13265 [Nitrospinae bacterium CG11_big_fil_rev_8_21_14_0_20_56_8]
MDLTEARCYLNHLLTLNIRREEAFGPLAFTFIKDDLFDTVGLLADEKFTLIMATVQSFTEEPKRWKQKLDLLKKGQEVLKQSSYSGNTDLARKLDFEIRKTEAELEIYDSAMRGSVKSRAEKQRLIVQSDVPRYFLDIAQKRAGEYYQKKYNLSRKAKVAQHFGGGPRKFEPENEDVKREFPGACAPFMNSRTNAFHLMLPFDLKISRKPDAPLEGGVRVFYSRDGYSFPLSCELDRLCSYYDGQVVEVGMDDPNLLFVSVSAVREPEFRYPYAGPDPQVPEKLVYPREVLERSGCLGVFFQVVTNFKIWFDANLTWILIQGAPDLHEFGLQGGSGLLTRTHASDKIPAYAEATKSPWQDGLSFNFVNMHLQLSPDTDTALVPFNTPIFTLHPVVSKNCYRIEEAAEASQAWEVEWAKAKK